MFTITRPFAREASTASSRESKNPFKAQRVWPPDFTKLDPKLQFRLERKYRRRSKLKYIRPGWNKAVKLSAWGSCSFVLVYSVLFMDWGKEKQPFQGFRTWLWDQANSVWTTSSSTSQTTTSKGAE